MCFVSWKACDHIVFSASGSILAILLLIIKWNGEKHLIYRLVLVTLSCKGQCKSTDCGCSISVSHYYSLTDHRAVLSTGPAKLTCEFVLSYIVMRPVAVCRYMSRYHASPLDSLSWTQLWTSPGWLVVHTWKVPWRFSPEKHLLEVKQTASSCWGSGSN